MTALLERAGSKTVEIQGKKLSGKRWLALALWELLSTGAITMPDGSQMQVDPKDWLDTAKWVYAHIDGPPKAQLEQSGALTLRVIYGNDGTDDTAA